MRTPGRCTNTEGCWISASHRNVWLSVGDNFVCPNCAGLLSPPLPEARSFRAAKRVAAFASAAALGVAVVSLGAQPLSTMSWPGRSIAARVAWLPASLLGPKVSGKSTLEKQMADAAEPMPSLTPMGEGRAATEVAAAQPNSLTSMVLASNDSVRHKAAHAKVAALQVHVAATAARTAAKGPLMLFKAKDDRAASASATGGTEDRSPENAAADERNADVAMSQMHGALITLLSHTTLASTASKERPVVVPIGTGRPSGPETDAEPVILSWHHHGMTNVRHTHFLPAPAAAPAPASADAIAQICRIPSLLH